MQLVPALNLKSFTIVLASFFEENILYSLGVNEK